MADPWMETGRTSATLPLLAILFVAGCSYDGAFSAVTCTDDDPCPNDASCVAGFCVADPPASLDAGADSDNPDADLSQDADTDLFCPTPQLACHGECIDPRTSPDHCGVCNNACEDGRFCDDGSCQESCTEPTTECAGSCVDTDISTDHCLTCNNACDDVSNADPICTPDGCDFE